MKVSGAGWPLGRDERDFRDGEELGRPFVLCVALVIRSGGMAYGFQVLPNCLLQFRRFRELVFQCGSEPFHLVFKRFAVVFNVCCANIASRCEDMTMRADFILRGRFTKAGNVFVFRRAELCDALFLIWGSWNSPLRITTPCVVSASDFGDVLLGQFAVDAVNHSPHFPRIKKEGLSAAVAIFGTRGTRPSGFIACEKPEADGDLRRVKELAG